ncbi:MAG TPA: DUF732 domain-containing protein [Coleofasciculaceae cyanobacterium]
MLKLLSPSILKIMMLISFSLTTSLSAIASSPALAQEEFTQDALGVCRLYNLSGYSAINADGTLINLTRYCQQQQVQRSTNYPFWQSFLAVADQKTVDYAQTLGQQEVTAYGSTICPFLQNGGTLEQLRQIQVSGELPSGFEVAVAVAAINTYCPTYQSEIGR